MNLPISLQNLSARLIYLRYKRYVVPFILVISSIVLGFFVVVPQFNDYLKTKAQEQSIAEENNKIVQSIQILSSVSESDLSSDLSVAVAAIPFQKDYIGVLGSISEAAAKSGVGLSDFSFAIGNVSKIDVNTPLQITLQVEGPMDALEQFLANLSSSLPLSSITKTDISGNSSQIDVVFYYKEKPSTPKELSSTLTPLSLQDKALLQKLSTFTNGNEAFFFGSAVPPVSSVETASSSAQEASGSST